MHTGVGDDADGLDAVNDRFAAALGPQLWEFALTSLDTVGVPVWATWWTSDAGSTGGLGYGDTERRARVGALGESLENVCSLRAAAGRPFVRGSLADLRRQRGDTVVDPRLLGLPAGVAFDDDTPLIWTPMRRLRDGADVLVPLELVASAGDELPAEAPPGGWLSVPVTNGLGAGSTLEQAVGHAVLEVLQRDGNGLTFRALDRGVVLDLGPFDEQVRDEGTLAALRQLRSSGVDVLAKLGATDFGLPNVQVVGAAPGDDVLSATACGEAVHPDREVALRKAVLEFASARARKQFMHGPLGPVREVTPPGYESVIDAMDPACEEQRVLAAMVDWLRAPREVWRPLLERTVLSRRGRVPFGSLPTTDLHGRSASEDVLQRLEVGGYDVLVADLSPGVPGVHAAKVVVPGLEVETVAYGRIGERNTRRLLDDGREDLVRIGGRPPGWAHVHLTVEAAERLGGPAWLDRAALDAVADGLLPLYREPSRHTAQKALQQ